MDSLPEEIKLDKSGKTITQARIKFVLMECVREAQVAARRGKLTGDITSKIYNDFLIKTNLTEEEASKIFMRFKK